MYRLLIIDDEDIIRKGLKVMIQDLGFEFTDFYEAENGLKAMEVIEKYSPELILTDIKMPQMDGIELIKRLRQQGNNARVLILTGYSEFEYAREALRYRAAEYLLKPVKREELFRTVKTALEEIKEEAEKQMLITKQSSVLNKSLSVLLENKLKDALSEYGKKRICFSEFLSSEGITFNLPGYVVLCGQVQVLNQAAGTRKDSKWRNLIRNELLKAFQDSLVFSVSDNTIAAVINFSGTLSREDFVAELEKMKRELLQDNILVSWGVSENSSVSDEIPLLFHQSRNALKEKYIYGPGKVFFSEDLTINTAAVNITESDITKMIAFLEIGENKKFCNFISALISEAAKRQSITGKHFEDTLCKILLHVTSHFKGNESASRFITGSMYEFIEQLVYCNNFEEGIKLIMEVLEKTVVASGDWKKLTGGKKAIQYSKQYIQNYYYKDLNLDMVANQVSMNPSYFSVLFKKEEGLSLVDYINDIRINKAMEYLRDPQYKIYEVAEKVGFKDEKYFCKVFKKKVEVVPTEYREKYRA